ncbi:MAG: hypothetical protein SPF87_03145 [Bacilli bacterium]|nr:hypothetical protein [Bacilli bacterium]
MSKKHNNSFDYVGAALSDNSILATEVSKTAFDSLRGEAIRVQNTPYHFSKGNIFEFIQGSKLQVAAAERGKIFNYNPVNAGRGLYQSPDDLSIFVNGYRYCFQAKVSDDPQWIIDAFSQDKYRGMCRITVSDMYEPVKHTLERKLKNGTITKNELDTLHNLKSGVIDPETGAMVKTSNAELDLLSGRNGKVDLAKVERYIEVEQNKAFINECINNTKSVTLVSTISGCVLSSVKNFYKYYRIEQDIETTSKNIIKDTAKAAGHGLLSSSIANGIKYFAFRSNNLFFRENVNSLVFANGIIDVGSSYLMFKKGEISYNDFLSNIIASSALVVINLGINYCFAMHPFLRLVTTIILNQVCNSIFKSNTISKNDNSVLNHNLEKEFIEELTNDLRSRNEVLKDYLKDNHDMMMSVNALFNSKVDLIRDDNVKRICLSLGLDRDYQIYESFDEKLNRGDKIQIFFGRKK